MDSVFVHELAFVENDVELGDGTKIWHFAQVRTGAKLGKDVIVGKSSFIDTGVVIGNNVKIQNLVSVYNGVTIGDNVFVGPHVAFTNDMFPRAEGDWQIVKTHIDDGASIGANSTIVCGNNIGSYALIAAGSVVIRPVPPHALIAGNPGNLKGWVCFCAHKIAERDLSKGNHTIICSHCGRENSLSIS